MDRDVLEAHLQHHWTAATGGLALFRRVAGSGIPEADGVLDELAAEIDEDREALRGLMLAVGVIPTRAGALVGRAAELVGRLKPNGRIVRRSPLSDLLEIEALCTAVPGKRAGWEALRDAAQDEPRLDAELLDSLMERADSQVERLRELHLSVAHNRMRGIRASR